MRIHAFPASPRAFKVLAVANHLGLDYELRILDLTKGEQRQPDFVAINPNMKMPALEDGDLKLWESNAIIQYLAAKSGAALWPADERARADIARWMYWESTTWDPPCATLIFEHFVKGFFGGGGPDPAEVQKAMDKFNFAAGVLDGHLKGRRFICGDAVTLADFAIGSALTGAELAQLPLAPYAEIARWSASLAEQPCWQTARTLQETPAAAA